jgi:hypothetical protein
LGWATALFIGLAGCASFEHLTTVVNRIPEARECGKCHVEIYREWAQSDHAKAYTNPEFRQATDDYAFESCVSCHAPEPAVTDRAPRARGSHREEGITCVCCHLEQGELTGPIEPTGKVTPHPVGIRPEFYRSGKICATCHEGTFDEWNMAAGKKEICQQCHMEVVVRKVTQPTEAISHLLVAAEKTAILRRHDFSILGDYIRGKILTVRGKRKDSVLTLRITNNLPHDLPTGDFGFRVLDLQVIAVDKQGREIVVGQRELAPELSTAIGARSMLTLDLEMPADIVKAIVRLQRRSYQDADVVLLADVELSL